MIGIITIIITIGAFGNDIIGVDVGVGKVISIFSGATTTKGKYISPLLLHFQRNT
jgi:hypothetical protein